MACTLLLRTANNGLHAQAVSPAPPNIVFVMVDDGRFDEVRENGAPDWLHLPNIERIASEGVNFTRTYAPTPLCGPSRASIYTGVYSHQHGVANNGEMYNTDLPTVQQVLKDHGYYTGFIGKYGNGFDPPNEFDYWVDIGDAELYKNTWLNVNGSLVWCPGHITDAFNGYINAFFDSAAVHSNQPFALFFFQFAPHTPNVPRTADAHLFDAQPIPMPADFVRNDSLYPDFYFEGLSLWVKDTSHTADFIRDRYECLVGVDDNVHTIFNRMDSQNITDSTLMIYTSDNGYLIGEHMMRAKVFALEESLHVPLFVRYPNWFAPDQTISNDMVELLDIPVTLLDAAGIPDTFGFEGISLRDIAEPDTMRHYVRYMFEGAEPGGFDVPDLRGVRSFDELYVHSNCDCYAEEFYDLKKDPLELHNQIFNVNYQQKIQQFRTILDSMMLAVHDTAVQQINNCKLADAFEIPDDEDNDCDGLVDDSIVWFTQYRDLDADGFGSPLDSIMSYGFVEGYVLYNSDCDDTMQQVHPGAIEICNGLDDNCNGLADDSDPAVTGQSVYYQDTDDDGYGDHSHPLNACSLPEGYAVNDLDCDDANHYVTLGSPEICNGFDDNCNGSVDEGVQMVFYADPDGDDFGSMTDSVLACELPLGFIAVSGDCDDLHITYTDTDGDGYGASLPVACGVVLNGDCNNANPGIHPANTDICDLIDNDCDGLIDEDLITPVATASGPLAFCSGSSVIFTASPIYPGYTFRWYKNGISIAGATNSTYTAAANGNYKVQFTAPGGCITQSAQSTVTVYTKPKPTITNNSLCSDLCIVNPIKLATTNKAGYTFQWLKNNVAIAGATTNKYNVTLPGNYKVQAVDAHGCIGTSSVYAIYQLCKGEEDADVISEASLTMYPNPTDGEIQIELAAGRPVDGEGNISIFNLTGQEILRQSVSVGNGTLDITLELPEGIAAGLYLVSFEFQGQIWTRDLMVQ